ncbi:MAG TPA: ABC transporter, partial [Stellaceae bacterium]|nr:ABC transporter [Stellaceae bacterium]
MTVRRLDPRHRVLLITALALALLPVVLDLLGLTLTTAATTVSLAIAALGLNLLVGYTGLTSFGHSAWFGIGGFAAALAQKDLLPGQIFLPILLSMGFVAILSAGVGALILRRRGVYFSLLTLALVA